MKYKKSLGQHYLSSVSTAKKIVSYLNITQTDTVLEIGAGQGALTKHIVSLHPKKLIIIELDDNNCSFLKRQFPSAIVICKDASKINYNDILQEQAKLVSNLPYNVGTKILTKVLETGLFSQMVLMFQKEVADRIVAKLNTRPYSRLSILSQLSYNTKYLLTVKQGSFTPSPKVLSAVIELSIKRVCPYIRNIRVFKQILSISFNNRRKMLRVSLKSIINSANKTQIDKVKHLLSKRPQELSINDFIGLANSIS